MGFDITAPYMKMLHMRLSQLIKGAVGTILRQNEDEWKFPPHLTDFPCLFWMKSIGNFPWKVYFCLILTEGRTNCSFQGLILSINLSIVTNQLDTLKKQILDWASLSTIYDVWTKYLFPSRCKSGSILILKNFCGLVCFSGQKFGKFAKLFRKFESTIVYDCVFWVYTWTNFLWDISYLYLKEIQWPWLETT